MSRDAARTRSHGHSAFRIEAGEAKILIDSFLSDNPSRDKGWSCCLTGENSKQRGDR
jgi:L-ascorbate metabolism protein UlaG (beta-lactamase superfamily)